MVDEADGGLVAGEAAASEGVDDEHRTRGHFPVSHWLHHCVEVQAVGCSIVLVCTKEGDK
jgi:hypothetical protein